MGFFFYLATAIVGLPALMVFPAVLPHVLTWIMNRRRIKGKVGAANIKFEWPAFVTLNVNDVTLTNPPGFEHKNMVVLKTARGTVNVWSLFTKSVKLGTIEVQDLDIFVERQNKKGINVSAYLKQVKGEAPLEIADGEEDGFETEQEANMVLSLLGMVQLQTDRVAENFAAAVDKEGGIAGFAKNTTSNVITGVWGKLSNVAGATSAFVSNKASSLENDVKSAGGIDKFVVNTTQTVATAVTDKTKEGLSSVKEGGLGGAATFAKENVSSAVGTVASTANDALLQEALHRKVMGCYKEQVETKYVDLNLVKILRLTVDARKLFKKEDEGEGMFKATEALLRGPDLEPHPKALRKDGLPVTEFVRRIQVIINYQMRKENTGAVFKTVTPRWLLPKKGVGAGGYIQGVASGATGVLAGVAKTGLSAVGGAGSKLAAAGKSSTQGILNTTTTATPKGLAAEKSPTVSSPKPTLTSTPTPKPTLMSSPVPAQVAAAAMDSAGGPAAANSATESGENVKCEDFDDDGVVLVGAASSSEEETAGSPLGGCGGAAGSTSTSTLALPITLPSNVEVKTASEKMMSKVGAAGETAKETVGGLLAAGQEKAPGAIKGATDLIGGVLGGTGEALTKATGSKHFDDAGQTVAGAFDNLGGALGGLFGAKKS